MDKQAQDKQPLYRAVRRHLGASQAAYAKTHRTSAAVDLPLSFGVPLAENAEALLRRLIDEKAKLRLQFSPHEGRVPEDRAACMLTEREAEAAMEELKRPAAGRLVGLSVGLVTLDLDGDRVQTPVLLVPITWDRDMLEWDAEGSARLNPLIAARWRAAKETDLQHPLRAWQQIHNLFLEQRVSCDADTCTAGVWDLRVWDRCEELDAARWPEEDAPLQRQAEIGLQEAAAVAVGPLRSGELELLRTLLRGQHVVMPSAAGLRNLALNIACLNAEEGRSTLVLTPDEGQTAEYEAGFKEFGFEGLTTRLHELTGLATEDRPTLKLRTAAELGPEPEGWVSARDRLNRHYTAMHTPLPDSTTTPYQLMGELVTLEGARQAEIRLEPEAAESWAALHEAAREMAACQRETGVLRSHPFAGAQLTEFSPTVQHLAELALEEMSRAAGEVEALGKAMAEQIDAPAPRSRKEAVELTAKVTMMLSALQVADVRWEEADWSRWQSQLMQLQQAASEYQHARVLTGIALTLEQEAEVQELRRLLTQSETQRRWAISPARRDLQRAAMKLFPHFKGKDDATLMTVTDAAAEQLEALKAWSAGAAALPELGLPASEPWGVEAKTRLEAGKALVAMQSSQQLTALKEYAGSGRDAVALKDQLQQTEAGLRTLDQAFQRLSTSLHLDASDGAIVALMDLPFKSQQAWCAARIEKLPLLEPLARWNRAAALCRQLGMGDVVAQLMEERLAADEIVPALERAQHRQAVSAALEGSAPAESARETVEGAREALSKESAAWFRYRRRKAAHAALETMSEMRGQPLIVLTTPDQVRAEMLRGRVFDTTVLTDLCALPEDALTLALLRTRQMVAGSEGALCEHPVLAEVMGIEMPATEWGAPAGISEFETKLAQALEGRGYQTRVRTGTIAELEVMSPEVPDRVLVRLHADSPGRAQLGDAYHREWPEATGTNEAAYLLWLLDWYRDAQGELSRLLDALDGMRRKEAPAGMHLFSRYRMAVGTVELAGRPFHSMPVEEIVETVRTIVLKESPIHMAEVARRLADGAGLARLGARSLTLLETAFLVAAHEGLVERRGNFLWLPGQVAATPRDRRGLPKFQRKPELLAPEEVRGALECLQRHEAQRDAEALALTMCHRLGLPEESAAHPLMAWALQQRVGAMA